MGVKVAVGVVSVAVGDGVLVAVGGTLLAVGVIVAVATMAVAVVVGVMEGVTDGVIVAVAVTATVLVNVGVAELVGRLVGVNVKSPSVGDASGGANCVGVGKSVAVGAPGVKVGPRVIVGIEVGGTGEPSAVG